MSLPENLKQALQQELETIPLKQLVLASQELSHRYRHFIDGPLTETQRLAYLAVRLPATYAAIKKVLLEVKRCLPTMELKSLSDLGAGPGTATWAASEVFPEISTCILHERDPAWINLGQRLMQQAQHPVLTNACWQQTDLLQPLSLSSCELVIFSYVLGELPLKKIETPLKAAWEATTHCCILLEPGTPKGFEWIKHARTWFIDQGAFILAPCPHQKACPMAKEDWCHFMVRLERSSSHRLIKQVDLGYEDEKFAYLVAVKHPAHLPKGRLVRHPHLHSGHVELTMCTEEGIQSLTISRRSKEIYKQARKCNWGDRWP